MRIPLQASYKRIPIIAATVLIGVAAGSVLLFQLLQTGTDPGAFPYGSESRGAPHHDTARFASIVLNPKASPIAMYWRDADGTAIRSLGRLRSYHEERGKRLRFAMNGGMYRKDLTPVGLFIQNGRLLSPLDTLSGEGNFYLKPNGVFLVRNDSSAAIVTTSQFTPSRDIAFANQSGPMLLIGGAIHQGFRKSSEHRNIRNGVGVRPDGTVVFAISLVEVTLYDFAAYFKEMGCHNALYLDGFVSRCYLPEKNLMQLDGDFGVIIGVTE